MSFPLYLDEDVDPSTSALLRQEGFDALSTHETNRANRRIPDVDQLVFATDQGRAIVTHNVKDYEPLALEWANAGRRHAGIIISVQRTPANLVRGMRRLQADYPDGIENYCLRLPRA